jgi:hypothetical protein
MIPIEIDDDAGEIDDEEGVFLAGLKRLGARSEQSATIVPRKLSAVSKNGIHHLRVHFKSCVQKKIELNGKTLSQATLRFGKTDAGTFSLQNYTFHQYIARQELSAMTVLH